MGSYELRTATFRLFPPYVISLQETERFLSAFESAILTAESAESAEESKNSLSPRPRRARRWETQVAQTAL